MKRCYFIAFTSLFLALLFLIFNSLKQVEALDYAGLSLSPPTFELSANPGDNLKNTIRVQNLSEVPMKIVVERRNFTALGEEGGVDLSEVETPFSLASWITVFPSEAEIPAKGTTNFLFQTAIPLNAEPGGHFGSIVFRLGEQGDSQQSGAKVAQELGALVLLRVSGKTTEKASLVSFSSSKKIWNRGPVEFEIRVKNEGNVHLKPTGIITIKDIFGRKVGSFNIDPKNVLPGAVRKSTATWDNKFLFSRYTATLALNYGTQGQVLAGSTTFYAFPYKIVGPVVLGLIILIFLLYKARRRVGLALKVLFGKAR